MDSSFLLCWIPGTCIHITDLTMTASSLYGLKNEQQIAKTLIAWEIVSRVIGELQLFSHNNEICFYNHLNVCKSFQSPKPRFSVSSNPLLDHPRLCLLSNQEWCLYFESMLQSHIHHLSFWCPLFTTSLA